MKTTLGSVSQDNNYDKMAAIMAAVLEVSEPLKIPCRGVSPFREFRFETNNFISSLVFWRANDILFGGPRSGFVLSGKANQKD